MNPRNDPANDSGANAQDDLLTNAGNDATANFWYDAAGASVVQCGLVPAPTVVSQDKKHWVEIALVDQEGNPVSGESYEITVPGGSKITGLLNSKGTARVNGVYPGTCKVRFPDLEK